ncbi:hypothetical protein SKAU_G00208870 [Synaphobranchus kaupii]|uniref:Uncharacterized protein n=1 Tax=Synaphobranchus kaupii TaxID=118154 RepID=A0A9Q1F8L9_SYNKA|nr:hypothetical protein SKAU_G00208870 [Synaphobranchus kaupii]
MLHLPPSEYRWLSPAVARSSPGGECGALPNAIGSSGPSSSMDNSGSAQTARGPVAEHSQAHKPRLNSGPLSPDTGGSAAAALGSAAGLPDRPAKGKVPTSVLELAIVAEEVGGMLVISPGIQLASELPAVTLLASVLAVCSDG